MKLSMPVAALLLSASLSGCASFQASDWQASITLPASEDCYSFNVMSGRETRLPAESEECKRKKIRSIWLDSDSYKMLKSDIQGNCRNEKCKQITGAFDELFLTIDRALQMIPSN